MAAGFGVVKCVVTLSCFREYSVHSSLNSAHIMTISVPMLISPCHPRFSRALLDRQRFPNLSSRRLAAHVSAFYPDHFAFVKGTGESESRMLISSLGGKLTFT